MKKTILIIILLLTANAFAADLHVPTSQHPTIQAAINDANDGDTVSVTPGTHTRAGNRNIDFGGKAITVRSESGLSFCRPYGGTLSHLGHYKY